MRRSVQVGLLIATSGSLAAPLTPYGNARFDYRVHVPADLVSQRPPDNGDGQTWRSKDGLVNVSTWGSFGPGVLEQTTTPLWMQWNIKTI